jgi:glutamyl-tRNA reductase
LLGQAWRRQLLGVKRTASDVRLLVACTAGPCQSPQIYDAGLTAVPAVDYRAAKTSIAGGSSSALVPRSAQLNYIRVRFATFRDCPVGERIAFAESLATLDAEELVMLETCHRVELISVDTAAGPQPSASGADAVRRTFEVVAGFDSVVVAEEQLLGQARAAYESALAAGSTGPILNELFRRALRFGRRVRSHARPGADRSLADLGARWLLANTGPRASVLIIGTGEMGRRVAVQVARADHRVTVVSRSAERAQHLVDGLPGGGHQAVAGPLTDELVTGSASMVLAIRSKEPILRAAHLDGSRTLAVLDLSAPAAVDAEAAAALGDRLLEIDRLAAMSASVPVLEPAVERRLRAELEEEVERFTAWLGARQSSEAIEVLHHQAGLVRSRHLDRLRRRADLDPEQLQAVEAASAAMIGELLHGPSVELRRGGADADVVRRLFGIGR